MNQIRMVGGQTHERDKCILKGTSADQGSFTSKIRQQRMSSACKSYLRADIEIHLFCWRNNTFLLEGIQCNCPTKCLVPI